MESFVYEDIFEVPVLEVGVDVTSSDGEYIHPYDEVINLGSSASLTGGFTYTYSGNTLTPQTAGYAGHRGYARLYNAVFHRRQV